MRTSVASTLSVAGVVAAGVAAFALNTAVLTTGSSSTGEAAAPTTSPVGKLSAPAGAVSQSGSGSGTASEVSVPVTAGSTAVSATLTTYRVGEAGTVVVDTSDGTVTVANILPAAGWTSEPARTDADGTVKVHFVKGSARVEFVARMNAGSVDVKVLNDTPTATAPATGGNTPGNTGSGTVTSKPREHRDDDGGEEHKDDDRHEWGEDDDD